MADDFWKGEHARGSQRFRRVIALLFFVLVAGTIGYAVVERWSVWDAFYMTVITVTTVGYGEVHPLSVGGRVVSILLAIGGVGTVLYAFTLVAADLIEGGLRERFELRRRLRMIDKLTNPFIICGAGRIGSIIAADFRRQGIEYVIVERDPARLHEALERGDTAVEADASREDVLRRVGIDRARGLIAAMGADAENVYAVLSARVLRPDLLIISRAESKDAERKLLRAGANRVLAPYEIGALQMAQTALRPAVVDFVQLATSSENLELAMEQIRIGPTTALAGQSLIEANLRQRYGVVVVGVQRSDGKMEFNPSPETVMRSGDQLVVLGRPDSLKDLEIAAQ
jgi:voltage-gated potassium channel